MPEVKAPECSLVIAGESFRHFDNLELTKSIDTYSTASFTAPFEADRKEFRRLFRPFSFNSVNVLVDEKVRLTGELVHVLPRIEPDSSTVEVSCYSLPATMNDCCPPATAYPLEFSGMTLLQIAQTIASKFGIVAQIDENVPQDESDHAFVKAKLKRGPRGGRGKRGNKFARCALEPGDNADEFLVKLAQQIGLVRSDNEIGNLVFRDSDATLGRPVARFKQGEQPLVNIVPVFNPQDYFTEITAFTPTKIKKKGDKHTEYNPFTRGKNLVRPHCFKLDNLLTAADAPGACWAKLGRMLGNCAAWQIDGIATWRDPQGELWKPNTTVTVTAPNAMIYRESELLIRDVLLKRDAGSYTASLRVVLPGAFSGALPSALPWG